MIGIRSGALELLRKAYDSLPTGGRIYVHEMLLSETKDGPLVAAYFSMKMMIATEGKQFTASELDKLLLQEALKT